MLYDASSIQTALRTLKEEAAPHLNNQTILDLTLYELGNIIWKETRTDSNPSAARARTEALQKLLAIMKIHRINLNDLPAIAENASRYGLTFYDSAYLTIAQSKNLTLVTEDQQLRRAAEKAGHSTTQVKKLL